MKLFVIIMLLSGCGPVPAENTTSSELKVRGGWDAGESFSAVVGIRNTSWGEPGCSGVFISDQTLLTAGHCLLGASHVYVDGVASERIFFSSPDFPQINRDGVGPWRSAAVLRDLEYDLARVDFPAGTARQVGVERFYPVNESTDILGHEVVVVGFGLNEHGTRGVRRFGLNHISWHNHQAIEVSGPENGGEGHAVTAMGGDSGGALLLHHGDNQFSLAGTVVRGHEQNGQHTTGFSNLTSDVARRLRD